MENVRYMNAQHFILSSMFFLQFASLGVIVPLLSVYLTEHLHFEGSSAGIIFSTSSIAILISPWFSATITDNLISAKRLYQCAHIGAALILLCLVQCTEFETFLCIYVLYSICFAPTGALANTLTFHALQGNAHEAFGAIRMWGTIGWIAIAWLFSVCWLRSFGTLEQAPVYHMFYVSAGCSIFLVILVSLLPQVRVPRSSRSSFLPAESLAVLTSPGVLIVLLLGFLSAFNDRYFYFGAGPYLKFLGVPEHWIMPAMSCAQILEILALFLLGYLLRRFNYRKIMLFGLSANVLRFTLLSAGTGVPLTLVAFSCHGIAFALFFTSIFIYLDSCSTKESRAGVQLLCGSLTFGLASVLGSITAGSIMDLLGESTVQYWYVPAFLAILSLFLAVFFLRDPSRIVDDIHQEHSTASEFDESCV